jgi:hypothetical protein
MKIILENWRKYLTETVGLDENPDLSQVADAFETAKRPIPLRFRVAPEDETIETKEGPVNAKAGDAVMTGARCCIEKEHSGLCQRNVRTLSSEGVLVRRLIAGSPRRLSGAVRPW